MKPIREGAIGPLAFLATGGLIAILLVSLSSFFISRQYRELAGRVQQAEAEFMAARRQSLENEMTRARSHIRKARDRMDQRLRLELSGQVRKAKAVARSLWEAGRGTLSDAQIQVLIRESLRDVRFNNGRGYIFIDHIDGACVLLPILPWLEGADLWDNQDDTGHFILREFVQIVLERGEGFSSYRWYGPGDSDVMREKLSFVGLFEPLDWIIGAGEYLEDAEARLQRRVLEFLGEIRPEEAGVFFVVRGDGAVLATPETPGYVRGGNRSPDSDPIPESIRTILSAGAEGGGFRRLREARGAEDGSETHLALIQPLPDWDWTLVASLPLKPPERGFAEARSALAAKVWRQIGVAALFLLLGLGGALALAVFLHRAIRLRVADYRERLVERERELERASAAGALRQGELRKVIDLVPHQLYARDGEGRFRMANRATARFYDTEPDQLLGRFLVEVHPDPVEAELLLTKERRVLESGECREFPPERGWRPGGEPGMFQAWCVPFPDPETGAPGLLGIRMDVTEQWRYERERLRLRTAIQQASETVLITDAGGRIEYVNPAFERVSGYSLHEVAGKTPAFLQSGKHSDGFYRELWETLAADRSWRGRIINRRKDGGLFHVDATISPVMDKHGRRIHFVSIQRDVTHEVELEMELRQAQKMEAIGTLAGGIAHDFNNILFPILGYTEMTLEELPEGGTAWENLREIHRAVNRARDLIGQILTFSRMDAQERRPLRLAPIIKESMKLLRASIPTTIAIETDLDVAAGPVLADPTRVQQILINLCTNAYHAMRERGGRMVVRLREADSAVGPKRPPTLPPGRWVCVSVSDTGVGMTPEVAEKIFEPYFTTRERGEGTGMGLAMVHGIVKDLAGEITVESRMGEGSEFRIWLPLADSLAGPETEMPPEPASGGTEHILVVDDEIAISEMMRLILTRLGYAVTAHTHPDDAWASFRERPDDYDLLISDMTMPGRTGLELARGIQTLRPGFPVVLCTGYSEKLAGETDNGITEVIRKPVAKNDLAAAVRRALSGGPAAAAPESTPGSDRPSN
ncbi:MAG: cache domain-containing protein [Desulfococcaceae bacterium]